MVPKHTTNQPTNQRTGGTQPTDEQTSAGFGKQQKTQEKVSFQAITLRKQSCSLTCHCEAVRNILTDIQVSQTSKTCSHARNNWGTWRGHNFQLAGGQGRWTPSPPRPPWTPSWRAQICWWARGRRRPAASRELLVVLELLDVVLEHSKLGGCVFTSLDPACTVGPRVVGLRGVGYVVVPLAGRSGAPSRPRGPSLRVWMVQSTTAVAFRSSGRFWRCTTS